MPTSLFQDPSSAYVYSYGYGEQPGYSSKVQGYLINGATYDTSASTINGGDLLLQASKSQYLTVDMNASNILMPGAYESLGFTLTGWFNPTSSNTTGAVLVDISGAPGTQQRTTIFYGTSNTLQTYYNSGTGITGSIISSTAIGSNSWHFFCLTVSCNGVSNTAYQTLFIDGITNVFTNTNATYNQYPIFSVTYGGRVGVSGSYFDGRINEIRIYSRVLSKPEIGMLSNIYNYIGYLKYQNLVTNTDIVATSSIPLSITAAYNASKPVVFGDGVGTNGVAIQVDLSGVFSYLYVTRTPAFSQTDPTFLTYGAIVDNSGILTTSVSRESQFSVSSSGQLTFYDYTAIPGISYSYLFSPYTNDLINTNITVTTPSFTPTITVQSVFDVSYGAQTGIPFGLHGSQVQINISDSFTYISVTRTPAFDSNATVVSPGTITQNTLQIYYSTKKTVAPSNATVYLYQTPNNTLAIVDTTVFPNVQYSYTVQSTLKGSSSTLYSSSTVNTQNTVAGGSSIKTPSIAFSSLYDASYGAIISTTNAINGAVVQIDVSGTFTALDISRNPAFVSSEISGLNSNNILRVYDASANLAPTTNAYLSKCLTYTGVSGEVFIDKTAYPGATYSYYFIPYIRDGSGTAQITWNTVTQGNTIFITATSTGITSLPVNSPYTPPSNGISNVPLTTRSIPGISISTIVSDPTSGASAVGGFMGGSSGIGGTSGSSSSSSSSDLGGSAAGLSSGSAGLVTSVTSTGASPSSVGLSGTGGVPAAPPSTSPGTITLANGNVSGVFTGTLPSTVSTYFVANTTSTGTVAIGQSMTVPTPPAGQTGCNGTLSFFAWPAAGYDPGTTLTVLIGGIPILTNFAFPSAGTGSDPYTPFNIPFSNLPPGNAQVSFLVTNSNGTSNSSICMGGVSMNYSFTLGSGSTVTDTSGLVLYYPFDVSTNVGTAVKNYASAIPVTDASLNGTAAIVSYTSLSIPFSAMNLGTGCLSIDGTSTSYTKVGNWTLSIPTASGDGGFSITGWFCATSFPLNAVIFGLQNTSSYMFLFLNQSNQLSFFTTLASNVTVPATTYSKFWYHFAIVCRYNNTTTCSCSIFINGGLVGTSNTLQNPNTASEYSNNYFGGIPTGITSLLSSSPYYITSNNFVGYIDDIRVYNRVLTANEVTALWMYGMNNIILPSVIDPTALTIYYPIEV